MSSVAHFIDLSPLDEERFGIRTARATGVSAESLPEVLRFCIQNHVTLVIARCSVSDARASQAMEREGFLLMDTLLFFVRDLRNVPPVGDGGETLARLLRPGDEQSVRDVALKAFHNFSGHYHSDTRLDPQRCDEVYSSWAFRTCTSGKAADQVLVAERKGAVAGFASIRLDGEEGDVVLLGVDPAFQGRGIARSLLVHSLTWCREKGARRLLYSTQIANLPIQRVLARIGFEPSHGLYTFHKWFGGS